VVSWIAILSGIGEVPLLEPDEGRNAEVAREMLEAGEWVVPRFHGFPYLDKPVLYFDAVSASFALFGRSEATARIPSVLFALVTALAAYRLGERLLGRRQALAGVAVLSSAPLFMGFARIVIFDMALACFVTGALLFAEEGGRGWRWGFPLAWVATALAVLTKGPVGFLLPVLGIVSLSLGQGRALRAYLKPVHLGLFLTLVLPWLLAMESRNPGFLRYALQVETLERLTRPTFERSGPRYYYLPVLFLALFPWSLASLRSAPRWARSLRTLGQPSPERGMLLAAGSMVLFFTLSTSKLPGYVLPALPLLALLVGSESMTAEDRSESWGWTAGLGLAFTGILLTLAVKGGAPIARWLQEPAFLLPALQDLSLRGGILCSCLGLALIVLAALRQNWLAPGALSLAVPMMVLVGKGPAMVFAEEYSSRKLVSELRRLGGEHVRVATVLCFRESLDFYLGRVVPLVTRTGGEISSTYVQRNFDRIGSQSPGVWTEKKLSERLRRNKVDVLITSDYRSPAPGFRVNGRAGAYFLWTPSKSGGD
jgi:4-amino-4-deoxy-L-arabinose transferase-like glycosyltransferase